MHCHEKFPSSSGPKRRVGPAHNIHFEEPNEFSYELSGNTDKIRSSGIKKPHLANFQQKSQH